MTNASQCAQILRYMKEYGGITAMEAFRELNCTRLSGRIYDLRGMGYRISGETVRWVKDDGEVSAFTRYYLDGEAG